MPQVNDDSQVILALSAMEKDPKLSARAAAALFGVRHEKLSRRKHGLKSRRDISANSRKLDTLEEEAIVQYILHLDSKGFPPRMSGVEDMANRLLSKRNAPHVGTRWAQRFVARQPALRTRFNQKYDHQRAKCEDPELIRGWFALVRNTIAKYGIVDDDIYNFDETGFLMGQISSTTVVTNAERRARAKSVQPGNREWVTVIQGVSSRGWAMPPFIIFAAKNHLSSWYENSPLPRDWVISVTENGWTTNEKGMEWIRHFEKHTGRRRTGRYRLLVVDGHESHHSDDFELFCQEKDIITLCMPPHSSHLLQPLDVGCFGPLKAAYGKQISDYMRAYRTHISKEDFLPAFYAAFQDAMTESNVQGGFRGAGLHPFDPEHVISKLDLRLKTPTPPGSRPGSSHQWTSKTPSNAAEASLQSNWIKNRIASNQSSSPTSTLKAVDQITKGATQVMHNYTLLQAEVRALQASNEELSKRRRKKKRRLQLEGSLSIQGAQDLQDRRDVEVQLREEMRGSSGRRPRTESGVRHCGNCGQPGHYATTCQNQR